MINILLSSPLAFFTLAFALVISITIHEFAHAWVADRLGDPTPRAQDRVTLDPRAHLDPIGTLAILFTGFGWGKPVVFDPYNLENKHRDILLIAAAGPLSNIALATALTLLGPLLPLPGFLTQVVISINLILAIFNLIPIHPLDGGKILSGLLPRDLAHEYDEALNQYGLWVLLLLVFPWAGGRSAVSYLVSPVVGFFEMMLTQLANIFY